MKLLPFLFLISMPLSGIAAQVPNNDLNVDGYDSKGFPNFDKKDLGSALSSGGQYGRKKIAQWGDPLTLPQTRTRCIGEAWGNWPWGGEWRTCNQWATDYRTMQVEVYMNGIGPTDLSEAARSVVENIVATCVGLSSAVAVAALWATPSPEPTARVAAAYAGASATFTGCLSGKAAELTAVGLATAAIKLAFEQSAGWSNWSNE